MTSDLDTPDELFGERFRFEDKDSPMSVSSSMPRWCHGGHQRNNLRTNTRDGERGLKRLPRTTTKYPTKPTGDLTNLESSGVPCCCRLPRTAAAVIRSGPPGSTVSALGCCCSCCCRLTRRSVRHRSVSSRRPSGHPRPSGRCVLRRT